jgi:hypothetical protein
VAGERKTRFGFLAILIVISTAFCGARAAVLPKLENNLALAAFGWRRR